MIRFACIGVVLALAGCASTPPPAASLAVTTPDGQRRLEMAGIFLTGTWQSVPPREGFGDPTPTRLMMAHIWPDAPGQYWIYAEQLTPQRETPVRQRLYRLREEGGQVIEATFALPGDPLGFAGEWRKERPFARVDPESLRELENCRMRVAPVFETSFAGRSIGTDCAGDQPGIATETTGFDLTSSELSLWIQGFDSSGRRVAGDAGPLELRKISREVR